MTLLASVPITILFIAVFALFQIPITISVGLQRVKTGIQFLDGGNETLLKRMRAHGNFTETVPISLLAMAAAEASGAPDYLIWGTGTALLLGRAVHYYTLVTAGEGTGRAAGMLLTILPLATCAVYALAAASGLV